MNNTIDNTGHAEPSSMEITICLATFSLTGGTKVDQSREVVLDVVAMPVMVIRLRC